MILTRQTAELKFKELKEWLDTNLESHTDYKTNKQKCEWYIRRLAEMDDLTTNKIEVYG